MFFPRVVIFRENITFGILWYMFLEIKMNGAGNGYLIALERQWKCSTRTPEQKRKELTNIKPLLKTSPPRLTESIFNVRRSVNIFIFNKKLTYAHNYSKYTFAFALILLTTGERRKRPENNASVSKQFLRKTCWERSP